MTTKANEQRERKSLAGSTAATTYFQQSQVAEELDAKAGRFAKPSVVSGANPTVQYPRLPSSSPWSSDPVGLEPALGYSINNMLAVGEPGEISASLNAIEALHLPSIALAGPVGSDIGPSPSDVVRPGPANSLAELLPKLVKRRKVTR